MNSFELAGEAMLKAQEGHVLIASAAWSSLRSVLRRVGKAINSVLSMTPGPHRLH